MELLLQEVHVAVDWEENNSESNPFVHRSLENRVYTLLDLTWNFFFYSTAISCIALISKPL
jgi:hypothetical protein